MPTLTHYLNFPSGTGRMQTEMRLDEATINLVPEEEQLSMLCKLICSKVLIRLATNHIDSFNEVHPYQWKSWMRKAAEAVRTNTCESAPWWRNPDMQGYADQPSETRTTATETHRTWKTSPIQLSTIHATHSNIAGQ